MVKFLHLRRLDDDNQISGVGGTTFAYEIVDNQIAVHFAECRKPDYTMRNNWDSGDQFNKEIGRQIAAARLRKEPYMVITKPPDIPVPKAILDWYAKEIFTVPISIKRDEKKRWTTAYNVENV